MDDFILHRDDFSGNFITKLVPNLWGRHGDLSRYYFGLQTLDNALKYSKYSPSKANNSDAKYIAIDKPEFKSRIVDAYFNYPQYFIDDRHYNGNFYETFTRKNHKLNNYGLNNLDTFVLGKGRDNNGDYISYYDIWDTDNSKLSSADLKPEHFGSGKPFEVYDRIYLDDYYKVPKDKRGTFYINEITITPNEKLGGKLNYIKFYK